MAYNNIYNYEGYQLKINGITLPCYESINKHKKIENIIESGSYSVTTSYPLIEEWTDVNGTIHRDCLKTPKTTIRFTIKERTLKQQAALEPIFESQENITIKYWDDKKGEYKIGTFFMDEIEAVSSKATPETIYYDKLNITYTEY